MAKIGKYELVRQLATGGMAEVFLAKTEGALGFEKTVVVKRISPHLLGDPQFLEMFLQEAKLAAQLNHPNIAQVFDFGESGGDYYLAMEHVDGPNLRTLSTQAHKAGKPIPFPLCAKIVSYACEGLAFAHEYTNPKTHRPMNIVHRDVSPDNIVLAKNGAVKVVDFGIAKAAEQLYQTQSGYRKGKLAYMSPEYLKGTPPDRRSDVYALGVVLYELISNKKPYDAEDEITLMHAMIYEPMVPVRERRPDVPEELERIVDRALVRDPDERYGSCREMQAALERYIVDAGEPLSSVHLSKVLAGLQPELEAAAAAAKTPNRKATPSGKTPSGPKTPPKKGSSGEKKAAGASGEKRKGATPPKPITFKDLEPEERTVEMNGPAMVAKAVSVYGEGSSNEATQELTAQDLAGQAGVVAKKIEPAPKPPAPEPQPVAEPEERTQERTSPALDVGAVLPPKTARKPSGPKRIEPPREPAREPAVLVLTRKQLVAAAAVALALMLMGAGIAVMVMRQPPAKTETTKAQTEVEAPAIATPVVTAPVAPPEIPKPAPAPVPVEKPRKVAKPAPLQPPVQRVKTEIGQGTAIFTTFPPNVKAAVYIDNDPKPRGTAPCELLLPAGSHSAKFVNPKQPKPEERQFTVSANKTVGVVATFP